MGLRVTNNNGKTIAYLSWNNDKGEWLRPYYIKLKDDVAEQLAEMLDIAPAESWHLVQLPLSELHKIQAWIKRGEWKEEKLPWE